MKLQFEIIESIGTGNDPDVLHMYDNEVQLIYLKNGKMYGRTTHTPFGEWDHKVFEGEIDILKLNDLSHFEIHNLGGFGAIGVIKSKDTHKLLVYEFRNDISEYLDSGSIHHSIDNPISSCSLSLENPKHRNIEKNTNVVASENEELIPPGSKIIFEFDVGDYMYNYDMGTFYVDRTNYDVVSETVSIECRNKIGKILSDQTVDEINEYWMDSISNTLIAMMTNAKLMSYEYLIQTESKESWFKFTPDTNYLQAIESIFKIVPTWHIREKEDGTIVIGSPQYAGFTQPKQYTFVRNTDVFSRSIVSDDQEVYRRVCVYEGDFNTVIYGDVPGFHGWSLQTAKTLYVEVAEGSSMSDMIAYRQELISRLSNVGKIETFNGPFRPHLQIGDAATIIDGKTRNLGLITEITHDVGKVGFTTSFTVDSGGSLSTGRVGDYIRKLTGEARRAQSTGNKPIGEDLLDLTYLCRVTASSERYYRDKDKLVDGRKDIRDGWQPDYNDNYPSFEMDLGRQVTISKIMLWLDYEDSASGEGPNYYRIDYWDSRRWVHLVTQSSDIKSTMVHDFESINASSIRFTLQQKLLGRQVWREVEIWGNM